MTDREMKKAVKLGKKLFTVYPSIEATLYGVYALQYFENTLTLIYTDNTRESCAGNLEAYQAIHDSIFAACQFVQDKARRPELMLTSIFTAQDNGEMLTPEQDAYARKIGLASVCYPS